ncbi:hypothetical protein Pint_14012 [Pistacia integerrima]|uniref:Uncharacterized protein n=1 Tax=Pistacia integerrima TaxID=434235 RepID=A0ACC0Y8J8_9ROSI|nr:hypothetical protein Pint_14012 [Pistacia integerrima]
MRGISFVLNLKYIFECEGNFSGIIWEIISFILRDIELFQMCPKCDEHCCSCCRKALSVTEEKQNADMSCPLSFTRNSQHSTVCTMSESTAPNFVYRRRKLRGNSVAIFSTHDSLNKKRTDDCLSVLSSNALSVATQDQHIDPQAVVETEAIKSLVMPPNSEPYLLRSGSVQGEHVSDGAPKSSKQKMAEVHSINDSCSSSKSNMDLVSASMKTEVDDTGECSSSSVAVLEVMGKDLSAKDLCISILKSKGLLERFRPSQTCTSAKGMEEKSGSGSCSRSCKVCGLSESTQKLLICDNCEEAYHVSCCNPRMKDIPIDEWFCNSCLKKKDKILKEMNIRKLPNIISELGRCRKASFKSDFNLIESLLRDSEPYSSSVRVGKGFQAEVPDWSGPINDDVDAVGEPLVFNQSMCLNLQMLNSAKPSELSPIGNWLQCRQVIDGIGESVDSTVCGKWRRAPLFEVQTDDWECFCSVLWNPALADCAAPQELETEEVLKQLKYVEMLRPRLAAKRRKLERTKSGGSQDPTEKVTNGDTQNAR